MSPPSRIRWSAWLPESLLLLLVVAAPLTIGGVHRPTMLTLALVAVAAMISLWLYRRRQGRGLRVSAFGAILVAVNGLVVLQLIPLPMGVISTLAPASAETIRASLGAYGDVPAWHPLSLDPSATLWEAIKLSSCTLAFIVAHNLLYRRERRDRLVLAIVIVGALVTIVGFIGAVVAPGQPLLFYRPVTGISGGLISTSFVNPNHSAAFLTVACLLAIGQAASRGSIERRMMLAMAAVLTAVGVFLTLSRGGIGALAVGLGAITLLFVLNLSAGEGRSVSHRMAWVTGALGLAVGLVVWLAYEPLIAEFDHVRLSQSGLGKIGLWPYGAAMVADNPWVGVGRGAFMTAFPRYLGSVVPSVTLTHMENQYLQLPAELGIPAATALVLGAVVALARWTRRGRRDAAAAATTCALVAVAVHGLVDFGMELLGLAMPMAVLAGALSAGVKARGASRREQRGSTRTVLPLSLCAILLGLVVVGLAWFPPTAFEDARRLQSRANRSDISFSAVRADAHAVSSRHPADHAPHLVLARRALRDRRPDALRWLGSASRLFPQSPAIHLNTAHALLKLGRRGQALLEVRAALAAGAPLLPTLSWTLRWCRRDAQLVEALPSRPRYFIAATELLIRDNHVRLAAALSRRGVARWPRHEGMLVCYGRALALTSQHQAVIQLLSKHAPSAHDPRMLLLWAESVRKVGRAAESLRILERASRRFSDNRLITYHLALAHVHLGAHERATEIANQLLAAGQSRVEISWAHRLLSQIFRAQGRIHRAEYEAEQAKKLLGPPMDRR